MGLAPGLDLLDDLISEASSELAFADGSDLTLEESKFSDLPLWYASLVAPPTWDEPAKATEPEPCTRLFWRATVARWPIDRRQVWGDRANTLQDAGLDWKEAERSAFEEIMGGLGTACR